MLKIELRNNITAIIRTLKTKEIIKMLDQSTIDKSVLLNLLIESKAGYDQNAIDEQKKKIFDQFKTDILYSSNSFTNLLSFVATVPVPHNNAPNRQSFMIDSKVADFYSFHKTLVATNDIVNNLLFDSTDIFEDDSFDIQKNQNKGNLMLQIIDDGKVDLKKFSEIVTSLNELIGIIYLLYEKIENIKFEEHPEIEMIDSGSDINFVVKLPEKAANLLAQIFKQFWDVIVNNKSYRYKQKLKDIENTISVIEKIHEAKENGTIGPEMAEILKKGILENTEKIVFRNTLPKQIVLESKEYSNRQILIEKTNSLLLENSELGSPDKEKE